MQNNKARKFSHETALESEGDDSDMSPCDTTSCLGSRYHHDYLEIEKKSLGSNLSDRSISRESNSQFDTESLISTQKVNLTTKDVRIRKVY